MQLLLVLNLLLIHLCTLGLSLRSCILLSIVEIALVLWSRVIGVGWFRTFFICNIGEFCIQRFLKRLHKFRFLFLNICLVGVTNEINIFSELPISSIFCRIEWVFLLELVKSGAINLITNLWTILRMFSTQVFPVHSLEEWMIFDFLYAFSAKSVISVAHESLQNIGCCWRKVDLSRDVECLLPV